MIASMFAIATPCGHQGHVVSGILKARIRIPSHIGKAICALKYIFPNLLPMERLLPIRICPTKQTHVFHAFQQPDLRLTVAILFYLVSPPHKDLHGANESVRVVQDPRALFDIPEVRHVGNEALQGLVAVAELKDIFARRGRTPYA